MISYVKGQLMTLDEGSITIEISGIGYEVLCANPFHFQDFLNKEVKVHTYHYIREDNQSLYGFKKKEDKQLFAQLLNVSGIGPKGALAILGTVSVPEFVSAIEQEDDKYLTKFPGVGKKTARQMILDLKGKLVVWLPDEENEDTIFYQEDITSKQKRALLDDAMEALKALGYTDKEVKIVRSELEKANHSKVDDYVRRGLQLLMKS
ncbi:Holliday junction DNA helicase subunit RuvA [Halobacillus karajensis]|uniref:Holliday junction branch migration complex subunit RuvA n=1 Tax=Halobacillus karajensis TaxID=195088 RepID=A0A024P730_9BACI|nr:Holliday junction branch migration protein RuvA [Halobacillus karajensis]CDQ18120.1 Holliday junction ATP-dependent DNA helicase RuvA [Halobacillus karajensis]CDQ24471.1 Holliday junction ATP-dependent DNA helicase RuvA [Halobacillus karajensis]CDQ29281.1 Holliday junction ATP-dependent DNA helicase RuvA [Halobacillus karajensis]SEH58876.1 Holliday junction DNA helicase subunit RuvA [Halobacillus karajensis]